MVTIRVICLSKFSLSLCERWENGNGRKPITQQRLESKSRVVGGCVHTAERNRNSKVILIPPKNNHTRKRPSKWFEKLNWSGVEIFSASFDRSSDHTHARNPANQPTLIWWVEHKSSRTTFLLIQGSHWWRWKDEWELQVCFGLVIAFDTIHCHFDGFYRILLVSDLRRQKRLRVPVLSSAVDFISIETPRLLCQVRNRWQK